MIDVAPQIDLRFSPFSFAVFSRCQIPIVPTSSRFFFLIDRQVRAMKLENKVVIGPTLENAVRVRACNTV